MVNVKLGCAVKMSTAWQKLGLRQIHAQCADAPVPIGHCSDCCDLLPYTVTVCLVSLEMPCNRSDICNLHRHAGWRQQQKQQHRVSCLSEELFFQLQRPALVNPGSSCQVSNVSTL